MKNSLFRHSIFFILLVALVLTLGCSGKPEKNSDAANGAGKKIANLEYLEDFFDFGSITQGEVVTHTFRFRNSGNVNLVIKDIIPDCGCTSSKIEKKVIKPNEEGEIEIIFDSNGWRGLQYKSVTIRSNSIIREKSVTFKANVVTPKEQN